MGDVAAITDPTDWVDTGAPLLQPVDNALRCQVCKEFFNTPMMTSCAHTFCSLCIRRCLTNDGKCPSCRAQDQPIKLRRNWILEELVVAYTKARPSVLQLAHEVLDLRQNGTTRSLKRKLQDLAVNGEEGEEEGATTRRKTRSQSRRTATSQTSSLAEASDDGAGSDDDYDPVDEDDGKVECPICRVRMKEEEVSPHMDRDCLAPAAPTKPSASMLGLRHPTQTTEAVNGGQERLSQLNYSILTESALRKKLAALGIPSSGNKQLLMGRHKEWVDIYNANYDATRPRTRRDLLKDLDTWEKTQGSPARSVDDSNGIMSKDFNGAAWAQKNDASYKGLIARARVKRQVPASSSPAEATADDKGDEQDNRKTDVPAGPLSDSTDMNNVT